MIRESDFLHLAPERRRAHLAWANGVLDRLGHRPEIRLTHRRAGDDDEPTSFEGFVGRLLTGTPDDVVASEWCSWPLVD
jgi:hypothetical protein